MCMLDRASGMLLEAADLIDAAMRMTGYTEYAGTARTIREKALSEEDAGSIRNMRRYLEDGLDGEDPGWTCPLDSVKNRDLKDI